jgi:hypothetical protein
LSAPPPTLPGLVARVLLAPALSPEFCFRWPGRSSFVGAGHDEYFQKRRLGV